MSVTHRPAGGFTLIELLIVIALVAILGTLAVPSLRSLLANQSLNSSASDLMGAALQARSTALRTNRRVIVEPASGTDWATGWRVYVDTGLNSAYDAGTDELVVDQAALPNNVVGETFTGTTSNLSKFAFEGTGFLSKATGFNDGTVVLKSTLTGRKKYFVVSGSGRGRICDPLLTPGCEPT